MNETKTARSQDTRAMLGCMALLGVVVVILWGGAILGPYSRITQPEKITKPLDLAVVQDICQKLALPSDCPQCRPGAVVYAPDFFQSVRQAFKEGVATYDEVESKLGAYCYEHEKPRDTPGEGVFFSCHYDLKGDRTYAFHMTFTDKGILHSLSFPDQGS